MLALNDSCIASCSEKVLVLTDSAKALEHIKIEIFYNKTKALCNTSWYDTSKYSCFWLNGEQLESIETPIPIAKKLIVVQFLNKTNGDVIKTEYVNPEKEERKDCHVEIFSESSCTECSFFAHQSIQSLNTSYFWDVEGRYEEGDAVLKHTFTNPGQHTVKLIALNGMTGCKSEAAKVIDVPRPAVIKEPCKVWFNTEMMDVDKARYTAEIQLHEYLKDERQKVRFGWDFGDRDKIFTADSSVQHTYESGGVYPVKVIALIDVEVPHYCVQKQEIEIGKHTVEKLQYFGEIFLLTENIHL